MIQVNVRTNTTRKTCNVEVTDTPKSVFDSVGVDVSRSMTNLNGVTLTATDLNSTFAALGVSDGTTANLNSIVKADGAAK